MIPVNFPQANIKFCPPIDLDESQCFTIHGFRSQVQGGSVDGAALCVTAWTPSPEELAVINEGRPIFLTFLGGIPPHFLSTSFEAATKPS